MSVFEYVALDERGRERKGFVDAPGVGHCPASNFGKEVFSPSRFPRPGRKKAFHLPPSWISVF